MSTSSHQASDDRVVHDHRYRGAGAAVDRIAVGPGGTRVVTFLTANQRGTTLNLDLQVTKVDGTAGTSAPTLSVLLARAPWEEEA